MTDREQEALDAIAGLDKVLDAASLDAAVGIALFATRLTEALLSTELPEATLAALTRDDGFEVARVIGDAFHYGTAVLRHDAGRLVRHHPADVVRLVRPAPSVGVTVELDQPAGGDVELEVLGRSLHGGDRLPGGQLADGVGQVVDRVLAPDDDTAGTWVLRLVDGRSFIIDPDRTFVIRRPATVPRSAPDRL